MVPMLKAQIVKRAFAMIGGSMVLATVTAPAGRALKAVM